MRVVQVKKKRDQERIYMVKVLGLCLVFIPLVTAGFFTPSPDHNKHNSKGDDVTVLKEGHPRVVIELEEDDNGNTKVSVSPQDAVVDEKGYVADAKEKLEGAKERIKEASSSVVPEILTKQEEVKKEGVGEATIGKAKDTVTRTLNAASDKAHEVKEGVRDAASEASSRAKDKVAEKASDTKQGAKEKAKEAEEMVDRAKQGAGWVKEKGKKQSRGILRRARDVVFRYTLSPLGMASSSVAGVLHLLGLAVAYGMCVWVTLASKYVLGGVLPRQQFAMVQSKMYPLFFKAMASSIGVALLGHLLGQRKWIPPLGMGMLQAFNLVAPIVMVLVNLLYLEPRTTKVMFERMKKEKEEGTEKVGHSDEPVVAGSAVETEAMAVGVTPRAGGAAAAKPEAVRPSEMLQRRLNSYSSMLNVATLVSLTWHLVHLGQHLHAAC